MSNIHVSLKQNLDFSYDVSLGSLSKLFFNEKIAIVTNPKVAGLHLNYLLSKVFAKEVYIITVADGEKNKTLNTIQTILDNCFEHRLNRKSLIIGFGGGVIGDMSGFAASIYQRGIDFIQIPTTLLSQVDASVGGKTGVNNSFGKNLIGAFHQPKSVYIDTYFLQTLSKYEFNAGVAEMIKMAVCFNKDFFIWLESANLDNENELLQAIKTSVQIKSSVVSKDEKESGIRAALNYGHTFGHVIEYESGFKAYLHGEAIAIGMVMANVLALHLGLMSIADARRVKNLLQKFELPVSYHIKDINYFYDMFFLDKKSNSNITFIIPNGLGDVFIKNDISKLDVLKALKEFIL